MLWKKSREWQKEEEEEGDFLETDETRGKKKKSLLVAGFPHTESCFVTNTHTHCKYIFIHQHHVSMCVCV